MSSTWIGAYSITFSTGYDEQLQASSSFSDIDTVAFGHRKRIPSASSALIIGGILGLLQTLFLVLGAKPILNYMGVKNV